MRSASPSTPTNGTANAIEDERGADHLTPLSSLFDQLYVPSVRPPITVHIFNKCDAIAFAEVTTLVDQLASRDARPSDHI
jgi:hypothetical protein